MTNNPLPDTLPLPWTQAQFDDMKRHLTVIVPQIEDMLDRASKAGLDVTQQKSDLAAQKAQLTRFIETYKDKYK